MPAAMRNASVLLWGACLGFSGMASAELNDAAWATVRESFFPGRTIIDSSLLKIEGPRGAENGAQVPVTLTVAPSATEADAISKVTLLVDANPKPLVGVYQFTRTSGLSQISTRIRLDTDSYVRAIGETADGRLVMASTVINAGGGCAGTVKEDAAILASAGKIKLQTLPPIRFSQPNAAVFMIRHPMYTGLQRDSVTREFKPPFFIKSVSFRYDGEMVMNAELGVSTAEDPYLRIHYLPVKPGVLEVFAEDSEGRKFSEQTHVDR